MALRSDELHYNLQHLNGMLTTHEAAKQLDLSYWHFMHLVEAGRIPGVRVVDRWLFSPADLDEYKRRRYGELVDLARTALSHPDVDLTEKQATICRYLANSERPSAIARKLQQSRQAVYSQITLIREKVARILDQRSDTHADSEQPASRRKGRRRQSSKGPIPLPTSAPESEASARSPSAETPESGATPS
ncbi:MAG: helix-turn-helix domain-containing protein [Thermogemmatispora sp.]|jgi:excisionase family DNA binding protein|uniref:helix-turn-helix domain-containing protein n=1 Tax=Thermogemmatispora sp. TaxID=1968838 RepID=UPI0019FA3940|nr:helix-turn-helix domain-containing protein [Thermogemmatispora sp.]MBE3564630.1 helix-turn-helix domain-containing protein [Thermogemmatispora sp.]